MQLHKLCSRKKDRVERASKKVLQKLKKIMELSMVEFVEQSQTCLEHR
jgi:hypothetical protein